ncbi:MAG: branched-chain amino acid transaminase [Fimbriimonadales bacterium]
MTANFLPYAWFDGKLVPFAEANVPLATHGLQYGTSAFSGMRTITENGHVLVFRVDEHAKRLSRGAMLLNAVMPAKEIERAILAFVARNGPKEPAYIRPFVYAAGVDPVPALHRVEKKLGIYGLDFGVYFPPEGVRLTFSSYPRVPDIALPARGKIGGAYWTSSAAKTESHLRGYDDAIMLNLQGKVAEGSGMNIFLVKDGVLITPDVTQDILEGITRDSIIRIARKRGIPIQERAVDRSELLFADEIFLTGTAAGVTPVKSIESFELPTSRPIAESLQAAYGEATRGKLAGFEDWVTCVPV